MIGMNAMSPLRSLADQFCPMRHSRYLIGVNKIKIGFTSIKTRVRIDEIRMANPTMASASYTLTRILHPTNLFEELIIPCAMIIVADPPPGPLNEPSCGQKLNPSLLTLLAIRLGVMNGMDMQVS
jgi:hypothetical protein